MVKKDIKREEILAGYEAGPEAVITLINTIIAEKQKIIEQQAIRISELEERVKYLEERLNKNRRNSSKPPSTDNLASAKPNPKSQRIKSGKKPGGQEGHIGTTLMMVDNPIETRVYTVDRCKNCGKNLQDEIAKDFERRQVFDIPPVKISATEHRGEIKVCTCGCTNYAEFPEDVKFSVQYGTRLTGFAVSLHDYQLIPYDRCCQLLMDVCGCEISPATLIRAENICFEYLKDFEEEIKKLLSQSPVIHSDETGSRINWQRHWLHVACTSQMTYYMIHAKRGSVAMDAMGILPGFIGTAVHDFWKPYFKYSCNHSLCNTHLTRELTGIEENYDAIIKIGMEENPPSLILQDQAKKRGKKKQSTAKNLLDRFNGYKDDILRFMHDFEVPFENNQAERDVRMMKVQQKISGTFRSTQGAASFCRIRGYISTVKKNKLSVIDAITDVFSGKAFIPNIVE